MWKSSLSIGIQFGIFTGIVLPISHSLAIREAHTHTHDEKYLFHEWYTRDKYSTILQFVWMIVRYGLREAENKFQSGDKWKGKRVEKCMLDIFVDASERATAHSLQQQQQQHRRIVLFISTFRKCFCIGELIKLRNQKSKLLLFANSECVREKGPANQREHLEF